MNMGPTASTNTLSMIKYMQRACTIAKANWDWNY